MQITYSLGESTLTDSSGGQYAVFAHQKVLQVPVAPFSRKIRDRSATEKQLSQNAIDSGRVHKQTRIMTVRLGYDTL